MASDKENSKNIGQAPHRAWFCAHVSVLLTRRIARDQSHERDDEVHSGEERRESEVVLGEDELVQVDDPDRGEEVEHHVADDPQLAGRAGGHRHGERGNERCRSRW